METLVSTYFFPFTDHNTVYIVTIGDKKMVSPIAKAVRHSQENIKMYCTKKDEYDLDNCEIKVQIRSIHFTCGTNKKITYQNIVKLYKLAKFFLALLLLTW